MKIWVTLGAIALVAIGSARPDRNAFLNKPARNIKDVIAQAKSDRAVMDRFRRHFHMSRAEVLDYLGTLQLGRLQKKGAFNIYSVPPNNRIKMHVEVLPAGMPVYFDALGRPAMVARCANPMALGPRNPNLVEEVAVVGEPDDLRDVVEETEMPISGDVLRALAPETPAVPEEIETTGLSKAPIVPSNLTDLLLGLFGVTATVVVDLNGNGQVIQNVPEPATLAILGLGAAALIRKRRKS